MSLRYPAAALERFAVDVLAAAGLAPEMAADVASILVEGDLLGHDTHGLALLAPYLEEIARGAMSREGRPEVIASRGAAETWDGRRLPGPWLVLRALERAETLAREHATGTVVIRRSHHIACLAAYLRRATDRGLVLLLMCSDPDAASVAPFGGTRAVFTPDPIAIGFPTAGDPVLVDISASLTTNGLTNRLRRHGEQLAHEWLLDGKGRPSRDPEVLGATPPGTILPLGGLEAGHKGFGLALLVEALTGALAGHGRAEPREGWGASIFLQAILPEAFGGREAFVRETQWIAEACRDNPPRSDSPVRLPGEAALARRREQLARGVKLHPDIAPALAPWAAKLGVDFPAAL